MLKNANSSIVQITKPSSNVALLEMHNRPVNALGAELRSGITDALDEINRDADIRAVVLTGFDKAFSAGADLRQESELASHDQQQSYLHEFNEFLEKVEGFRVPVIAAINGHTVGGGLEFALCCDIRVCSPNATFLAAGVTIGLVASFWRLPQVIGVGPAKEILLSGNRVGAEDARRWGLVSEVYSEEELVDEAIAKAEKIAKNAPLSVETTKECTNLARSMNQEEATALQVEQFLKMIKTDDHREAISALFEKRNPVFTRS